MKLIIDIDEQHFEILQSAVRNGMGDNSQKIIANGIPLDKIRAEIQENIDYNKKMDYQGIVAGLLLTLNIINKYIAESEVRNEK